MKRHLDPAPMTDSLRLVEIASLFATGYRRWTLTRQKDLEQSAEPEALCASPVAGTSAGPLADEVTTP